MRVARQAATVAADLAAEVIEVVLGEAPFDERACVHARCRVTLEIDVIAAVAVVLAAEEVVEADLVEAGRTGEGGEVAADAVGVLVGAHDHDRGIPADVGADASLDVFVAGEPRFHLARDRVHVRGRHGGRERHLTLAGAIEQTGEEIAGAYFAVHVDDGVE